MACIASPNLPLRSQTTFRSKVQKSLTVRRCSSLNCPRRRSKTAFSDVQLTISGCNALALALGRFVFLPAIREKTASQGPGVQNGESHFTAGDARAEEAASVFATNDPAGFTIVDLLMWGSIGHAIGYSALASQSFVELLK
ncbi:photosystem I subunit V [Micromonas commoda]|uniref:PSI-G n=1 Tax=Micromonas commoda (strain RCC299 / NOUM17 / CCMP2709) TaxID=296587 RepID=C1FE99_MICCC|nr:photosystem I subunit V [Micromonas commoda]ACO68526.1 photosystem I subunit V [Micromonas commoda]|eukprot:XP_002507268.1 photosystem I subunit V [Micromonas commoda]